MDFKNILAGASILTVCELLDYVALRCSRYCGENKKTRVSEFSSKTQLNPSDPSENEKSGMQYYITKHK